MWFLDDWWWLDGGWRGSLGRVMCGVEEEVLELGRDLEYGFWRELNVIEHAIVKAF